MTVAEAERLWAQAHEFVRRGDFAAAVRDLARCYALLEEAADPRIADVHRRWTEVHQMYLEDGARPAAPAVAQPDSREAEAEDAANRGDLEHAIGLYEQIAAAAPHNELVRERVAELRAAQQRRDELVRPGPAVSLAPALDGPEAPQGLPPPKSTGIVMDEVGVDLSAAEAPATGWSPSPVAPSEPQTADAFFDRGSAAPAASARPFDIHTADTELPQAAGTPAPPTPTSLAASSPGHFQASSAGASADVISASEDDWSDIAVDDSGPIPLAAAARPVAAVAAAPVMHPADAPVGMGSVDVTIEMGAEVSVAEAEELPVASMESISADNVGSADDLTPSRTAAGAGAGGEATTTMAMAATPPATEPQSFEVSFHERLQRALAAVERREAPTPPMTMTTIGDEAVSLNVPAGPCGVADSAPTPTPAPMPAPTLTTTAATAAHSGAVPQLQDTPLVATASPPPTISTPPQAAFDEVAFLEELLVRVRGNRRESEHAKAS